MVTTVLGGGNDSFTGSGVADSIDGAGGNDTLRGLSGNDTLIGNADNDWLFGGDNDDRLLGGDGNDVLNGGNDDNFLDGGNDNDRLIGGDNEDTLIGGAGDDTIVSNGGVDYIVLGAGNDSVTGIENNGFVYIDGNGGGTDVIRINAGFNSNWDTVGSGTVNVNGVDRPYNAEIVSTSGYNIKLFNFNGNVVFSNATIPIVCFTAGTMIMTADGERPVESLRAGDLVLTASNHGAPLKPVRWIGRREVDLETHPRAGDVAPILILPGALGAGVPHRALRVSPEHALLVDGMLVPAGLLVDGQAILRTPAQGRVTYLHVELDSHDLLLSEGAATESYLEMGNRDAFANAGIVAMLHADFAPQPGHANAARSCRPRVTGGPALEAARLHLSRIRRPAAQDDVPAPLRASA